jgi:hypothetical protein
MNFAEVRLLPALLALALSPGCDGTALPLLQNDPYSEASFDRWLASEEGRKAEFQRFETYLVEQGVSDVVPAWQLLRTDANHAVRCGIAAFEMPPEAKWSAIVPALRLIGEEVIPVVGRVEVFSAYRSDELNACAKGAPRSRHLAFEAVDLVAPEQTDKTGMFADLCDMHRRVGSNSGMGLGAYFDAARPRANPQGRFHIDGSGFRTWGFDYTRKSSFCLTMRDA